MPRRFLLCVLVCLLMPAALPAQEVVGFIPRTQKPLRFDGKLEDWQGAFVTPVHVGHPDFANRGGQFLYLWDDKNLYVGLRCLDRKPAHVGIHQHRWPAFQVERFAATTHRSRELRGERWPRGQPDALADRCHRALTGSALAGPRQHKLHSKRIRC